MVNDAHTHGHAGAHGDPWAAYGQIKEQHLEYGSTGNQIIKPPWFGRNRQRMNLVAILVSFFFPWILFSLLYADTSFRIHYNSPQLCWILVGLAFVVVLIIGVVAFLNVWNGVYNRPLYQPTWLVFLFLTSLIAAILGPGLGTFNFYSTMQKYYDLENLNDYVGVDPQRMRGQQMMDAGRVRFVQGAHIDLDKAYAFQNHDTYCVAPITFFNETGMGVDTPLGVYDFWAVGLNCCPQNVIPTTTQQADYGYPTTPNPAQYDQFGITTTGIPSTSEKGKSINEVNFKCGAYKSADAREGLRFIQEEDEDRGFLRLAVQQAEARHAIKAVHPLFFQWTDNSMTLMHRYLEDGFKNYAAAMCIAFLVQLALVLLTAQCLTKVGYDNM